MARAACGETFRPEELATPEAFARDPKLVWEWYAWRREAVSKCEPNAAHRTLVDIEEYAHRVRGVAGDSLRSVPDAFTLITTKCNGSPERAKRVVEME